MSTWTASTSFCILEQINGRLASYTQQLHSIYVNHSPNPNDNEAVVSFRQITALTLTVTLTLHKSATFLSATTKST